MSLFFSPYDLIAFLECPHSTYLKAIGTEEKIKQAADPVLAQMGLSLEKKYLQGFQSQYKNVVEIDSRRSIEERILQTTEAIKQAADVIYQAAMKNEYWRGEADFLIKLNIPSALGDYSYYPLEVKLKSQASPKHILQLCVYSDLLSSLQNQFPQTGGMLLAGKDEERFNLEKFKDYYLQVKSAFFNYIQQLPQNSYPQRCLFCPNCGWRNHCTNQWQEDDHLNLIVSIRPSHIQRLNQANIHTMTELANTKTPVEGIDDDIVLRLRQQVTIQNQSERLFEWRPNLHGKGLARIPQIDKGDLFMDTQGTKEKPILFGIRHTLKSPFFRYLTVYEEEAHSFEKLITFFYQRLLRFNQAHIYCYGAQHITVLKSLAQKYGLGEDILHHLLQQKKIINLATIVEESLSAPDYNLRKLAQIFQTEATLEESPSILHLQWQQQNQDEEVLTKIINYSEENCNMVYRLRDWLAAQSTPATYPPFSKMLQNRQPPVEMRNQIHHLIQFHNRENYPFWWNAFERRYKSTDQLIEDPECLGGLVQMIPASTTNEKGLHYYQFPPQEHKITVGKEVYDVETLNSVGRAVAIDNTQGRVDIMAHHSSSLPEKLSIGPPAPIDNNTIRSAIYRYAKSPPPKDAITDILKRSPPRFKTKLKETRTEKYSDTLATIMDLDESYFIIQGPPGTGKTHLSAHLIVDLIKQGKKIGVSCNAHKALHILLSYIEKIAKEKEITFKGQKKSSQHRETLFDGDLITNERYIGNISLESDLLAGTAWLFSNQRFEKTLDFLLIDEASQVSTANVVAMGMAAKNIILVGDHMQLGSPIQNLHAEEIGTSILNFLLKGHSVVPAEYGVFLSESRRLPPAICNFISTTFYNNRLTAHPDNASQYLHLNPLCKTGIAVIHAHHSGCLQKSEVEAKIIHSYYAWLLGKKMTNKEGHSSLISDDDFLVITPYNIQANYLKSVLPASVRVGTVDKFQGQEAAIVILSMVTSHPNPSLQKSEFLYSLNRLNVSLSRAKCLSIVVANQRLFIPNCQNIAQMEAANIFCQLDYYAEHWHESPPPL